MAGGGGKFLFLILRKKNVFSKCEDFSNGCIVCMRVCVCLTQAAELTDDGRECVVHHTLQLAADALGELPSAEVTGLDVPLNQRHGEAARQTQTAGKHTGKSTHTVLDTG